MQRFSNWEFNVRAQLKQPLPRNKKVNLYRFSTSFIPVNSMGNQRLRFRKRKKKSLCMEPDSPVTWWSKDHHEFSPAWCALAIGAQIDLAKHKLLWQGGLHSMKYEVVTSCFSHKHDLALRLLKLHSKECNSQWVLVQCSMCKMHPFLINPGTQRDVFSLALQGDKIHTKAWIHPNVLHGKPGDWVPTLGQNQSVPRYLA